MMVAIRLIFLCTLACTLGTAGVAFTDWQFWAAYISALGLYVCGLYLGKEDD